MPKISIIVPVYNTDKYLHECIDSILMQTFQDFELLLINDGSIDNSGVICDEYAIKDSRIKVIHKENGGQSSARNLGLDIAKGEYIYFCDSDDYIESSLLEQALDKIQNVDMSVFRYALVDQIGTYIGNKTAFNKIVEFETDDGLDKILYISNELIPKYSISIVTSLFKRDIIEKYKIRFKPNYIEIGEDTYFILCYVSVINKISFFEDILYKYRQYETSTFHSFILDKTKNVDFKMAGNIYEFFERHNLSIINYFPILSYAVLRDFIKNNSIHAIEIYNLLLYNNSETKLMLKSLKELKGNKLFINYLKMNEEEKCFLPYYIDGKEKSLRFRLRKNMFIRRIKFFLLKTFYWFQGKIKFLNYKICKTFKAYKFFFEGFFQKKLLADANDIKKLVICAHPDDETIFFSKICNNQDTYVVCMSNIGDPVRKKEFLSALDLYGIKGTMYNMPDTKALTFVWRSWIMRRRLYAIKKQFSGVNAIYTHNTKGESGHPHHFGLGKSVEKVFNDCNVFFTAKNIDETKKLTEDEYNFKLSVMDACYKSQLNMLTKWCPWYESYMRCEGYETR